MHTKHTKNLNENSALAKPSPERKNKALHQEKVNDPSLQKISSMVSSC